jgi:hypothetical protein
MRSPVFHYMVEARGPQGFHCAVINLPEAREVAQDAAREFGIVCVIRCALGDESGSHLAWQDYETVKPEKVAS